MIPLHISNANGQFKGPDGDKSITPIWVRIEELKDGRLVYCTAWEPTVDELVSLNNGGSVVLRVMGGQPPVKLTVEGP